MRNDCKFLLLITIALFILISLVKLENDKCSLSSDDNKDKDCKFEKSKEEINEELTIKTEDNRNINSNKDEEEKLLYKQKQDEEEITLTKLITEKLEEIGEIKYLRKFYSDSTPNTNNQNNQNEFNSLTIDNFQISKQELYFLLQNKIVFLNDYKLYNLYNGNFAQFLKIAYVNNLPLYFTPDHILYAMNENLVSIHQILGEQYFFPMLVKFYFNIYATLDKLSETNPELKFTMIEVKKFFAVFIEVLGNDIQIEELEFPFDIPRIKYNSIIKAILKQSYSLKFSIMGTKQSMNFASFIPSGFHASSTYLSNLYKAIKWMTSFKFDLFDDMHFIWFLAKLINDSDSLELYNGIVDFIYYFYEGNTETLNFSEIYKIGAKIGINSFKISEDDKMLLTNTILESFRKINLNFLTENYTKESEDIKKERLTTITFFPTTVSVIDWFNNNLIDKRKKRSISMSDALYAIFNTYGEKDLIDARVKQKAEQMDGQRFIKFRDGVDYLYRLDGLKKEVQTSMNITPEKWRHSFETNYILMLQKLNKNIEPNEKIIKDKVASAKIGLTCLGSFLHFKAESDQNKIKVKETCKHGKFLEFYIEPVEEFYNEAILLLEELSNKVSKASEITEKSNFKVLRYDNIIYNKINSLRDSMNLLLKGINIQNNKKVNNEVEDSNYNEYTETIEKLNQIITTTGKDYDGWYSKLLHSPAHKNESGTDFMEYSSYIHTYFINYPNKGLGDPGLVSYEVLKHNKVGLILVYDEKEKINKLMIFSTYNPMEANFTLDKKVEFEEIYKFIESRQ